MLSDKNNSSENRRNLLEFFAEILDCCMVPQATTKVIRKANLPSEITTEIIKQMKFLGLLEDNQSLGKFVTATRGNEYLRRWAQLQELIDPQQTYEKLLVHGFNRTLSPS